MHPQGSPTVLPAVSPRSYTPGPLRRAADAARNAVDAFVAKHPEYSRLSPDVLLQYAATYRDDKDHALEQEYRDNCVLAGCRIDYRRPCDEARDEVPFSDSVFPGASQ